LTPLRLLQKLHLPSRRQTFLGRTLLPFDMPPTLPRLPLRPCAVPQTSVVLLMVYRECVDGGNNKTGCHYRRMQNANHSLSV